MSGRRKDWKRSYPGTARELAAALEQRREAPSCIGGPSFAAMQAKMEARVGALVAMQDRDQLRSMLQDARTSARQVNREPYSDPEDRYEAMANDYGDDLYEYYNQLASFASSALEEVDRQLKAGEQPQWTQADLDTLRAQEQAQSARRLAVEQEKIQVQKRKEERRTEVEKGIVERGCALAASSSSSSSGAAEASAAMVQYLDSDGLAVAVAELPQTAKEFWDLYRSLGAAVLRGFLREHGSHQKNLAAVAAAFAAHRLCLCSAALADLLWELSTEAKAAAAAPGGGGGAAAAEGGDEAKEEGAVAAALARRLAAPAAGAWEEILPPRVLAHGREKWTGAGLDGPLRPEQRGGEQTTCSGASPGNPVLLWACYKGTAAVVNALLDAYEGGVRGRGEEEEVRRRLTALTNSAGQNALHMAARVSGPAGRQEAPGIIRRLAKFIDPKVLSGEGKDVSGYIDLCQNKTFGKELQLVIDAARSQGTA